MPWVDPPVVCEHVDRPEPHRRDANRIWECPFCHERFKVTFVDYGHDVMPGEVSSEYVWRPVK